MLDSGVRLGVTALRMWSDDYRIPKGDWAVGPELQISAAAFYEVYVYLSTGMFWNTDTGSGRAYLGAGLGISF